MTKLATEVYDYPKKGNPLTNTYRKFIGKTISDEKYKIFQTSLDDPKYKSGQLVYNLDGLISAKDKDGNTFLTDKDDPRWKNGQIIGVTKGCTGQQWARYDQSSWIKGRVWITNQQLQKNKLIKNSQTIPDGWVYGRKIYQKELRQRIGSKGCFLIYNPETLQHRKIFHLQDIPQNFIRGSNYTKKETNIINMDTGEIRMLYKGEEMPKGFRKGWSKTWLKKNK